MKRLFFITALLVVSFTSEAQVVIRTNKDKNVKTVSSTVIKKEVIYKERKLYDAKVVFQQFIELSPKFSGHAHTGINYIGGWRFNNWIYAGIGTGLEFAHKVAKGAKAAMGKDVVSYTSSNYSKFFEDDVEIEMYRGSFNRVSIPLYLHCRAYYMRTRWAPYSSVSFGGRLTSKDCGPYFDFSTGVDWKINEDYHAYCSLGFWWSKFRFASGYNYKKKNATNYNKDETCSSSDCPLRDEKYINGDYIDHYHTTFYNIFRNKEGSGGISFRIGVSF